MLTLEDRLGLVLEDVWAQLPALKAQVPALTVRFAPELGAVHGQFRPESSVIMIHPKLCAGALPQLLPLIDIRGEDPPKVTPYISRMYHTLAHECFHALLYYAALDDDPAWLRLSGWAQAEDDPPGTERYTERRPGWTQGPSEWRYTSGSYFIRPYSARSPYEDAADFATHELLGWTDAITDPNGRAKRTWLRREVFGERGLQALTATTQRWRGQLQAVREHWPQQRRC